MRVTLLIITFLLVINTYAFGQDGLRLHIEGGPTIANFTSIESDNFESTANFGTTAGAYLDYPVTNKMYVILGVGFSELNLDREYDTNELGYGDRLPDFINLSYSFKTLEIPLALRYAIQREAITIGLKGGIRPVFISGHQDERYFFEDNQGVVQFNIDLSDNFKNASLFVNAGTEIQYTLDENTQVFSGIRFNYDVLGMYEPANNSHHLIKVDVVVGLSLNLF